MVFANISTLYLPPTGQAGASLWGTDVRKLLSAAHPNPDSTTITNHGTGGAVVRTEDPYTTSTTDATQADYGWAVVPADMGSASGARRFYPAGNHVATVRMGHNGALGETGTISMYAYRVGPAAARTRTLLGSNTASVVFPITSGEVTMTCTVALAEVIFEVDETIQYSFELSLAGIIVVGHTATFFTGTQSSVACRIDTPKLGVLADTTGAATGAGAASGVTGKVLGTIGSAAGTVTVSGTGGAYGSGVGTAAGTAAATGLGSSVAGTIGTAVGAGAATGLASIVLGTVGTVEIGSGAAEAVVIRPVILFDD